LSPNSATVAEIGDYR